MIDVVDLSLPLRAGVHSVNREFLRLAECYGHLIEVVCTGSKANDSTGDTLRAAWGKTNRNFDRLSVLLNVPVRTIPETDGWDIAYKITLCNWNFWDINTEIERRKLRPEKVKGFFKRLFG